MKYLYNSNNADFQRKISILKKYLLFFGLFNIVVVSLIGPLLFGDLLLWQPRNLAIEMMISILYLSMGIIMLMTIKNPESNKMFIDFIILANSLHAIIMLFFIQNFYQLFFNVLSIGSMGLLPVLFYPWNLKSFLKSNLI